MSKILTVHVFRIPVSVPTFARTLRSIGDNRGVEVPWVDVLIVYISNCALQQNDDERIIEQRHYFNSDTATFSFSSAYESLKLQRGHREKFGNREKKKEARAR